MFAQTSLSHKIKKDAFEQIMSQEQTFLLKRCYNKKRDLFTPNMVTPKLWLQQTYGCTVLQASSAFKSNFLLLTTHTMSSVNKSDAKSSTRNKGQRQRQRPVSAVKDGKNDLVAASVALPHDDQKPKVGSVVATEPVRTTRSGKRGPVSAVKDVKNDLVAASVALPHDDKKPEVGLVVATEPVMTTRRRKNDTLENSATKK
jgi:hypothetical protein